jgi:hypothetical protein
VTQFTLEEAPLRGIEACTHDIRDLDLCFPQPSAVPEVNGLTLLQRIARRGRLLSNGLRVGGGDWVLLDAAHLQAEGRNAVFGLAHGHAV